jgi:hypothetical protein
MWVKPLGMRAWMTRCILLGSAALPLGVLVPPASAHGPAWTISGASSPTNLTPGDSTGDDSYVLRVINTGDRAAQGTVTITDELPPGVTAAAVSGEDPTRGGESLSCELLPVLRCTAPGPVSPGAELRVSITVHVASGTQPSVLDTAAVSGGGAPEAVMHGLTTIVSQPAPFGVSRFLAASSNASAGAHPNVTLSLAFNQGEADAPAEDARDVMLDLPPGLVDLPTATARCDVGRVVENACPAETAVGVAFTELGASGHAMTIPGLIYNIVPYPNEPAAFMFAPLGVPVRLDESVRDDRSYGIRMSVHDLTEAPSPLSISTTLWGVPADNDGSGSDRTLEGQGFGAPGIGLRKPFLVNPTQCADSLTVELSVDSWLAPSALRSASSSSPALSGCAALTFQPSISVVPDTSQAGAPAGYGIDIHVPQNEDSEGVATPELRNVKVTLPPGVAISPSAAEGLQGCSEAQVGLHSPEPVLCPSASRIGTVEVQTPLLSSPLQGSIYLATPEANPFGDLLAIYVVAESSGVSLKLAGQIHADPTTGQLMISLESAPQLPINEVKLHFVGGPRALLANPAGCGTAITTSSLSPWSAPTALYATPSSLFVVNGCEARRFHPAFLAQTASEQAGDYSPFTFTVSRTVAEEGLRVIAVQTPPGLLAMFPHVPLCQARSAADGTCPAASEVGRSTIAIGPGPTPFYLSGKVYLTGPHRGAPFGLSIVVPMQVGPFNLGSVVIEAGIYIDPRTARLTLISDPLPSILEGIPLQMKAFEIALERGEFIRNPTSCEASAVKGTIAGSEGAEASVSVPFQVALCAKLPFAPTLSASTEGAAAADGNGAGLTVSVSQRAGEANLHKLEVELPSGLALRSTTTQLACAEATFNTNPAVCPETANVGVASAVTPELGSSLSGPVLLIASPGASSPELVVVLQGEGVRFDLHGAMEVFNGISSLKFQALADMPFSSLQLNLPKRPQSVLVSPGGILCGQSLPMPTTITGQNGAQLTQSTAIQVIGCLPESPATKSSEGKPPVRHPKKRKAVRCRAKHKRRDGSKKRLCSARRKGAGRPRGKHRAVR